MMVNSLSRVLTEVQGGFPLGTPLLVDSDQAGGGGTITASAIGNSRMFTARQFNEEMGLYHYRARAYSPELRRFIQRDPLEYVDGPNAVAYCGQIPTARIDGHGLDKLTVTYVKPREHVNDVKETNDDGTRKTADQIKAEEAAERLRATKQQEEDERKAIVDALKKKKDELTEAKKRGGSAYKGPLPPEDRDIEEAADEIVENKNDAWTFILPGGSGTISVLPGPDPDKGEEGKRQYDTLLKHELAHGEISLELRAKLCGTSAIDPARWRKATDAANEEFHGAVGTNGAPKDGTITRAVEAGVDAANSR